MQPGFDDAGPTYSYAQSMRTADALGVMGPETKPSHLVDALGAAALAAFVVVGTYFASHNQETPHRAFDAWAVVFVVIAAGALALRHRWPVPVLLVVFAATLAYFALGYVNGPIWLALVIAYFTAIVAGHRLAPAIVAVVGYAIFPWLDWWLRGLNEPSLSALAALAAWLLVLFGVAEGIRIRRERAAETLRIREEEGLRRASEERLRIARELHDALGHHLSLISVQAGVALHVNEELPEEVRNSLSAIKQASKEGLTELRSVLEILRQDGERAPRTPTSSLTRVGDLVASAGTTGLQVRLETEGEAHPLPFSVDVAAFRIVQEALTNVSRHAGDATATVHIDYRNSDLVVQVDDDGRGAPNPTTTGTGRGVLGMRERVAALGGEFEAGPRPGGGFRVRARLPVEAGA